MTQVFIFQIIFLIVIFIAAIAAIAVWRRRDAPGALSLFLMMLAILEWNFAGMMQISVTGMKSIILWSKIAYLGAQPAQILFLLFVLDYTHHQKWLTRRNILLLSVMPVLTILLAFTNEWHHLIWTGFSPSPDGMNLIYYHGLWFWLSMISINCVLFAGAVILFRFIGHSHELYRYQNIALMIATLIPWFAFILYIAGGNPFPGVDTIPISFTFTGAILVFIITRKSFLDVIPIAREVLVDNMLDGLLVLDQQQRIVDINPSMLALLNVSKGGALGRPIEEIMTSWQEIPQVTTATAETHAEITFTGKDGPRFFDLLVTPIRRQRVIDGGILVIFRDITEIRNSNTQIQLANDRLLNQLNEIEILQGKLRERYQLEERRRLSRDLHDSLTQSLHSTVYSVELAQRLLKQGAYAPLEPTLAHIKAGALLALKEIRLLLYEMRLEVPVKKNLVSAINNRLEAVERRAGMLAEFVIDPDVSLPIAWNDNLYGLIMESLNNATKHASAKHLWVHFGCNQGLLVVSIKDDGCGFDLQEALVRGMGIQNMRERAELMGGRLEINSTLGAGTEISLWVEPKLELERKQEK